MLNNSCGRPGFEPWRATRTRPRLGRRARRGAALVEAIVVISTLTLGLWGLAFFRELYVAELTAMRLARAAVIAHSMAGCQGNTPREWIARDRGQFEVGAVGRENQTASSGRASSSAAAAGDPTADRFLSRLPRAQGAGNGVLNPIAQAEIRSQVEVSRDTPRGRRDAAQNIRARSYVSCGDEVKEDDLGDMVSMLKEEFLTFIGGTP